jgi:hypothetical protein
LREPDRRRFADRILALETKLAASASPSGELDGEAIWEVYSEVERLIATIRFILDYETPGAFAKLPDARDPIRLVHDARSMLSRSVAEIGDGRMPQAVETLRAARNDLRSYLRSKRLAERRSR